MKVIEGKILMLNGQNLKSQKHHLTKQLRKLLLEIENKPHQKLDSESLRIQVQQQERLRIVLHSLMAEFKDKIAYIQNTVYQQSVRETSYSPIPNHNRREYAKPDPQFAKSMQDFSPISSMSNYSAHSIYKKTRQYKVIVPSKLEFKNLIPSAYRDSVFRVGETLFEF
jgi:hypothetical protein